MTTKIKASLEQAIQDWADKCAEEASLDPIQAWWPDTLTARMADAAYGILMANYEGQDFAKKQGD